jgi:hypothetical protein
VAEGSGREAEQGSKVQSTTVQGRWARGGTLGGENTGELEMVASD